MKFLKLFVFILCVVVAGNDIYAQSAKSKSTKVAASQSKTTTTKTTVADQKPGVHMTFENEHLNIGKVKKGEIKKFDFVFTNTGTETIEIDIASGCDCTTLDYPKNKILPGKKGVIHVTFDSGKKDDSETVDVDLYLKNLNPKTGQRILKIIDYKYELIK